MLDRIKIAKVRDVKAPTRAHDTDAGLDFYIPVDLDSFPNPILLRPGDSVLIPSGIKIDMPAGYAMIFFNKSGNASKLDIDVMASVIDSQFQGEIHLNVINNGTKDVELHRGMKLLQGIVFKIETPSIDLVDISELYIKESQRGASGFGSTNNK